MKVLLILLIAAFAGYTKANDYNEMESIGFFQALAIDYMKARHCSDSIIAGKLKEEVKKAAECIKDIRSNSSFCETFLDHFKPCIRGVIEESEKCAEPSEIASKNTVLDSVTEVARYICGADGEHILELVNPCVIESVRKSKECRKNITPPSILKNDLEPLCRALPSLQKCFEDQMQVECENDLTRTAIHDFLLIDAKPCNIVKQVYFEAIRYI